MSDYRDLVIQDLALENHDLREANHQLLDLVADLAVERACLEAGFYRVLSMVDRARLTAQRERDAALEAQALERA